MRTRKPDFHGDGGHGDVEALRPDRVLRLGSFSALDERVQEFGLELPDAVGSDLGAGFRRTLPINKGVSVFDVAEWDALVLKSTHDYVSVADELASKIVDGLAAEVEAHNLGARNVVTDARMLAASDAGSEVLGGGADVATLAPDDAGNGRRVDAVVGGDGGGSFAGLIAVENVTSVEVSEYSGHVYNLTCEEGYFASSGGIVTSNTTGAYNAATLEAARIEQDETGTVMHKVWVATTDARTRDSHFAADGQRVGLDEPFLIGGTRLSYPGDPNAPAAEIVNCRCTILELAADEPLPGETDRQTERTRADGSRRNPAAEVAGRAADGVTRAREDPAGVGYIAAAGFEEDTMRRPFSGVLAPVGKPTGDGRILDSDGRFRFRDFPLPLMWQKSTSEGHDQSVIVGRIDTASVEGGEIRATGVLFESAEAAEAGQLLADEVVRPSVDLCDMVADFLILDADGATVDPEQIDPDQTDGLREMTVVREATVMAATLVAKPAFAEAKLTLGEPTDDEGADAEETLLASAGVATMARIDPAAFAAPDLTQPTGLTVTDEGKVFGHLALFDSCHVGMQDRCVTPPRTGSDYAYFHTSTVDTPAGPVS
ncbi:MAG: phage minor head protein, partial [Dietzia sp.]|nr:phage minor head protein [Dietzia sp.]